MICPNCKCEYIRGVTQCADCDVPLVDALRSTEPNPAEEVRTVAIWRGKDPSECEGVEQALENAGIPFTAPDSKSSFSFIPTEPSLEIWISEADQERARKILLDLEGRVHPDELSPEEIKSLALPVSDDADNIEPTDPPSDLSENWHEDDPAAEVWSGDSETFADNLIICLREIRIASRKLPEAGHWCVVVRPEQQERAKEIVREVVEARPLE
jgi:hypothetical protein